MAELSMGKGVSAGKIASNVQKKITRAQEKVRNPATCSSLICDYRINSFSFLCVDSKAEVSVLVL